LQPIHRYFEKKLDDISVWKHSQEHAQSRVVPLMVDDGKVVPLMEPQSPLQDQLARKLDSCSGYSGSTLLAIPQDLEPHVPDGRSYITLPDLKNVGVVSTR
jgi:hypothetical protein